MTLIHRKTINTQILQQFLKKIFITLLILSPIVLFFGLSYLNLNNKPSEHEPWISWYDDPSTLVYVSWETLEEGVGEVHFGTEQDNLEFIVYENTPSKIHHINISVTPNTLYYYKTIVNEEESRIGQFRSAPSDYQAFKWIMYSDSQQPKVGVGHHNMLSKALMNEDYAFVNIVGDHVDSGYNKNEWNDFFYTINDYSDRIPFIPVVGNHDRADKENSYFTDYFYNKINNTSPQFYYSFNYSSVHFTMLDFIYGNPEEFTDEQLDWLIQDLKNAQSLPFRVVMFHRPIVGAGFFGRSYNLLGNNEDIKYNLTDIFMQYNVTATVHGHEHHWERGQIQNMAYFIVGCGGGALDPGLRPQPETIKMTASPCYTEVSANATNLTFRSYTVDGILMDMHSIDSEV